MYTMLVMMNGQADKEQLTSAAAVKNIALLTSYICEDNLFNDFWWKRHPEKKKDIYASEF